MVSGIDIFREHFSNFKDQYTVIGGFACDLLMTDAGLDLKDKKAQGIHVNSRDIRKHRLDVFRLFQLVRECSCTVKKHNKQNGYRQPPTLFRAL